MHPLQDSDGIPAIPTRLDAIRAHNHSQHGAIYPPEHRDDDSIPLGFLLGSDSAYFAASAAPASKRPETPPGFWNMTRREREDKAASVLIQGRIREQASQERQQEENQQQQQQQLAEDWEEGNRELAHLLLQQVRLDYAGEGAPGSVASPLDALSRGLPSTAGGGGGTRTTTRRRRRPPATADADESLSEMRARMPRTAKDALRINPRRARTVDAQSRRAALQAEKARLRRSKPLLARLPTPAMQQQRQLLDQRAAPKTGGLQDRSLVAATLSRARQQAEARHRAREAAERKRDVRRAQRRAEVVAARKKQFVAEARRAREEQRSTASEWHASKPLLALAPAQLELDVEAASPPARPRRDLGGPPLVDVPKDLYEAVPRPAPFTGGGFRKARYVARSPKGRAPLSLGPPSPTHAASAPAGLTLEEELRRRRSSLHVRVPDDAEVEHQPSPLDSLERHAKNVPLEVDEAEAKKLWLF